MSERIKRIGETNSDLIGQVLETIKEINGIGTDYKFWQPCILEYTSVADTIIASNTIRNTGATDFSVTFVLPIAYTHGSYSLWVDRLRITLLDADADDFVDSVEIRAMTDTLYDQKLSDGTNRTAAGSYEYDVTDFDASGYTQIVVGVAINSTTANDLDITGVDLRVWYV